ncbi:MAG: hypothetical protein BM557_01755 [Flavobacterium sp. MedPE-SWcel]|uniref:DUF3857 domain-containing protein n=1 Tax=uncultured Flavobacterium sp. TaxID=165435 RepID=UPI00091CF130|nr:DUF3857 domain-containing protein [uncultured Flavobacterium sp.]OIQ22126.1 MAG: hypothetical protein BM557_01755 [Flavobacterium sp. MedPE-SWcel]
MKTRILIILLSVYSSIATAQRKNEVRDIFWGKNDKYNKALTIPDKWKNESAVVIYKNENYDFHKFGAKVTYTTSVRKRVKLLDKAAVEEFSEFAFKERFYSSRGYSYRFRRRGINFIGIKIVKPDGSQKEIDIENEAVKIDEGKKVAIPNLEIGDIIDFYYYSKEPFKSKLEYGFEPVETTLGDDYPIMDLKITLQTENDFFINFNTYNGAPKLKETTVKKRDRTYELVASDIEKNDFPRWFSPLTELPSYKFQVYFARSSKFEDRSAAFLPKKENIIKETVTSEDVINYYNDGGFKPDGKIKDVKKFIKKNNFSSKEEMVREVYYFYRYQYLNRYTEYSSMANAKIIKEGQFSNYFYYVYGMNSILFYNEVQFIKHFRAFLKSQKIEHDIIIATSKYNGPIKDLLIQQNTRMMIKVNTENPIYIKLFGVHSNIDQIDFELENTEAYILNVAKFKKVTGIETITLPSSSYKDNSTKSNINITVSPDLQTINIDKESSFFGHNKISEQKEKIEFYDYINDDYERYGDSPFIEKLPGKKLRKRITTEFNSLKKKTKELQEKTFKRSIESELDLKTENHSLKITNTGRYGKNTPFVSKEKFSIKEGLLKKAGSNYIFEIGKLIGGQIEIDQKEKNRTNNIYIPYPRSFEDIIEFTIPDGYTVAGLDKLNKKVENSTGGFISSTTLHGNKLTIKVYKYYTNYYEPNSNWNKMINFLDSAYQFTQEKILLKKK